MNKPDYPAIGWTIDEAMSAVASPEDLERLTQTREAWLAAGRPAANQIANDRAKSLKKVTDDVRSKLRSGILLARGRPGGPQSAEIDIAPETWAILHFYDAKASAAAPPNSNAHRYFCQEGYYSIRIWRAEDLPDQSQDSNVNAIARGGRPAAYPWDAIVGHLMVDLMRKGEPGTQSELIRKVQNIASQLARARTAAEADRSVPEDSTIRRHFARYSGFLDAIKPE